MLSFFALMGVVFVLLGLGSCGIAKTAPGEIEGLILILTGTVFMVGSGVMSAINAQTQWQEKMLHALGAPRPDTHVRCPDCKGLVAKDAVICMHCSCRLTTEA